MALAQRDFSAAQRAWNDARAAFDAECQAIEKENNWPAEVTCDLQSLKFIPAVTKKEKEAPPKPVPDADHKH